MKSFLNILSRRTLFLKCGSKYLHSIVCSISVHRWISYVFFIIFEPYYESLDLCEPGLLIPESVSDLQQVERYLARLRFIMRTTSEIVTGKPETPHITAVSRGSIELFVQYGVPIATCTMGIFYSVLKIYEKILTIQKLRLEIKQFELPKAIEEMEQLEKKIVDEEREKIVVEILHRYGKDKLPRGEKAKLEKSLRVTLDYMIRMRDDEAMMEATPPSVKPRQSEDSENAEGDQPEKDPALDKKIEQIKELCQVVEQGQELIKTGKKVYRIAHMLDPEEETTEEEEKNNDS